MSLGMVDWSAVSLVAVDAEALIARVFLSRSGPVHPRHDASGTKTRSDSIRSGDGPRLAQREFFTSSQLAVLGLEISVQPSVGLADQRLAGLRVASAPCQLHCIHVAGPAVSAVFHGRSSKWSKAGDGSVMRC